MSPWAAPTFVLENDKINKTEDNIVDSEFEIWDRKKMYFKIEAQWPSDWRELQIDEMWIITYIFTYYVLSNFCGDS